MKKRVLLFEDDRLQCFLLEKALHRLGVEVQLAENGCYTLFYLKYTGRYDLLVTDLSMPRIDGERVVGLVRSDRSLQSGIPIFVVSADVQHREQILARGANEFFPKPLDTAAFVAAVGRYLGTGAAGEC